MLEGVINGRICEEPERVARFLARWNLQALGLPPAAIDAGMATVANYVLEVSEVAERPETHLMEASR